MFLNSCSIDILSWWAQLLFLDELVNVMGTSATGIFLIGLSHPVDSITMLYHVQPLGEDKRQLFFLKSAKSFVSTCFSEHNFYYAAQNGNEGSWFYSTGGILIKGNKYLKERWAKCKRWVDRHQWHNYESHSRKEIKSQERKNILLIPKEKFKKFTTRIYFST